jgi:plasmid replication initiation protein
MHHRTRHEREQLELFRALPGDLAPKDAQDLRAYPFLSLAKTHRMTPIDFRMNEIAICVEAVPEHDMATISDADVLIWATSQIVEARDAGLRTSRLMVTTPREILTFTRRGTGARDYHRLKAALDRLQSTTVATSLRQTTERRMHRFSWIKEWTERADAHGNADGIDLIMPDGFYRAVLDDALVLTIGPAYFGLTGGLERWLYRLVRKHAGRQHSGWRFDFRHLHAKSASLSPFKRFAFELRDIACRQPLPGYRLFVERPTGGRELLAFMPAQLSTGTCGRSVQPHVLSGTNGHVPSGTAPTCNQEPDSRSSSGSPIASELPNLGPVINRAKRRWRRAGRRQGSCARSSHSGWRSRETA